jgi:hypothetical protein
MSEPPPLLLDTHVWIWLMLASSELAVGGRTAINPAAAAGNSGLRQYRFGTQYF